MEVVREVSVDEGGSVEGGWVEEKGGWGVDWEWWFCSACSKGFSMTSRLLSILKKENIYLCLFLLLAEEETVRSRICVGGKFHRAWITQTTTLPLPDSTRLQVLTIIEQSVTTGCDGPNFCPLFESRRMYWDRSGGSCWAIRVERNRGRLTSPQEPVIFLPYGKSPELYLWIRSIPYRKSAS